MKCTECNHNYNNYGLTEGSISLFCRTCFHTTWLEIPNYIPQNQNEKFADKLFTRDYPPQHLIEEW